MDSEHGAKTLSTELASGIDDDMLILMGKAIAIYQAIENAMKSIGVTADLTIPEIGGEAAIRRRLTRVGSSTMGAVVDDYMQVFAPFVDRDPGVSGCSLRVKAVISLVGFTPEEWAHRIDEMVSDRNWLVHQSLAGLQAKDMPTRTAARERVVKCLADANLIHAEVCKHQQMFSVTQKLAAEIQHFLPAVDLLGQMVFDTEAMRPDGEGWIPVDRLRHRCAASLEVPLTELYAATRTNSFVELLQGFVQGIQIVEQTTKRGKRLVYRYQPCPVDKPG